MYHHDGRPTNVERQELAATAPHSKENPDEIALDEEDDQDFDQAREMATDNPDEILLDEEPEIQALAGAETMEASESIATETVADVAELRNQSESTTKFLALSKPGHGRDFLQVRPSKTIDHSLTYLRRS